MADPHNDGLWASGKWPGMPTSCALQFAKKASPHSCEPCEQPGRDRASNTAGHSSATAGHSAGNRSSCLQARMHTCASDAQYQEIHRQRCARYNFHQHSHKVRQHCQGVLFCLRGH